MFDFKALFHFQEQPGLYFFWATMLPLLSFVLLLLAGGVRFAARRYRGENDLAASLHDSLGGDVPQKIGAYIATAAIGLAFILVLIGFLQFQSDQHKKHDLEKRAHEAESNLAEARQKKSPLVDKLAEEHEALERDLAQQDELIKQHWSYRREFARIGPPTELGDSRPGTVLELGYRLDHLSMVMFLMVTFVATLIHLFSIGYMSEEQALEVADHQVHTAHGHLHRRGRFGRFFMFLSLFCFSMLNLILADNLFQVFISWELVGICSFLLIGFYFERTSASNAANKAFITNRIGDAGFIIGLLIVWTHLGTFNFEDIFAQVRAPVKDAHQEEVPLAGRIVRFHEDTLPHKRDPNKQVAALRIAQDNGPAVILFTPAAHVHGDELKDQTTTRATDALRLDKVPSMPYVLLTLAGLGIFLGCVGKSAQFPLQVWLPDAMEGPTPVSALIHAATMVAAGVYLVGRCFPLFTAEALLVIAYTGAITLFVAATIAIVMTDIKKVLAYSTVSQLGYMMLALGLGGWVAGLFHLVTHAFFKALLFLGSGSVIYGCHHEQEMTKMGGLLPKMRITGLTMLVGVLAIAGIPLFSGWYSKDAILAQAIGFVSVHPEHLLLFILPLLTAGITTFYMFRMWLMTFTGKPRDHHVHEHAHESPWVMTVPLILLAAFSVCVGWGQKPWDPHYSFLADTLHHAQPVSVQADFGAVAHGDSHGVLFPNKDPKASEAAYAHEYGHTIGNIALGIVLLAIAFAFAVYYFGWLDPAEAQEQFPGVHRFLVHKWYFDELYSVMLVRPALAVGGWFRSFDLKGIDGVLHGIANMGLGTSRLGGLMDLRIVDGLANLIATVAYAVGGWLRTWQTGYLRSYILFLALAAVAIFAVLAFFVARTTAGG